MRDSLYLPSQRKTKRTWGNQGGIPCTYLHIGWSERLQLIMQGVRTGVLEAVDHNWKNKRQTEMIRSVNQLITWSNPHENRISYLRCCLIPQYGWKNKLTCGNSTVQNGMLASVVNNEGGKKHLWSKILQNQQSFQQKFKLKSDTFVQHLLSTE